MKIEVFFLNSYYHKDIDEPNTTKTAGDIRSLITKNTKNVFI